MTLARFRVWSLHVKQLCKSPGDWWGMHSHGPLMQPGSADKDVRKTINTDITTEYSVCKWLIAPHTCVCCIALTLPQLTSWSLRISDWHCWAHYTTVQQKQCPKWKLDIDCFVYVHTWAVGAYGSCYTPHKSPHRHELMMTFKSWWPLE